MILKLFQTLRNQHTTVAIQFFPILFLMEKTYKIVGLFTPSSITQTAKSFLRQIQRPGWPKINYIMLNIIYLNKIKYCVYIMMTLVRLVPVFSQFSQLIWLSFQAPAIWSFKMPKNSISKVAWKRQENIHGSARTTSAEVMLMAEIRRSTVEVVILSYYIFTGFYTSQVVVWDFWTINSTKVAWKVSGVPPMTSKGHHLLRFGMTGGPQQTYHPNTNSTSGGMTGCLEVILKIRKRQRISGTQEGSHNSSSCHVGWNFRIAKQDRVCLMPFLQPSSWKQNMSPSKFRTSIHVWTPLAHGNPWGKWQPGQEYMSYVLQTWRKWLLAVGGWTNPSEKYARQIG